MKYLVRIFLFLILGVGYISCDEVDLDGDEAGNVLGTWQARITTGNNTFVLISQTEFNFYEYNASLNCVVSDVHTVIDPDERGFYQIKKGEAGPLIVYALTANDERLQLRRIDESVDDLQRFVKTDPDFDVKSIPDCNKGKWEFTSSDNNERTFVEITDDRIQVVSEFTDEACFESVTYSIEGINGNIYKLLDEIAEGFVAELFVEIKKTQAGLAITLEEGGSTNTDLYLPSNQDLSVLGPLCSTTIPNEITGIWEPQNPSISDTTISHLELKPDSVIIYSAESLDDQSSCLVGEELLVGARRGDSFFLFDELPGALIFIFEGFLDDDVLVTQLEGLDILMVDEKYSRSSSTSQDLSDQVCN